jgi:hypothetical protein
VAEAGGHKVSNQYHRPSDEAYIQGFLQEKLLHVCAGKPLAGSTSGVAEVNFEQKRHPSEALQLPSIRLQRYPTHGQKGIQQISTNQRTAFNLI